MSSRHLSADDAAIADCQLLGGWFAYGIQALLGAVAIGSLVFKRFYIDRPPRPWRVWGFDVGKQLVGGGFVHFANIIVSGLLSGGGGDECAWYFLNYFIDCTLGVFIVSVVHDSLCRFFVHKYGLQSALAHVGVYGLPPKDRVRWAKQLAVYLASLLVNKVIVGCLLYAMSGPMSNFGDWLFGPLQPYPQLELVVVMVLSPGVLMTFQFLMFDALLKADDTPRRPLIGDGELYGSGNPLCAEKSTTSTDQPHGAYYRSPNDVGSDPSRDVT